jgi:hypothetical protein
VVDAPDKLRILFVENFPNSAKISASVIRALRRTKDIRFNFLATNQAVVNAVREMCEAELLDQTTSWKVWIEIILRKVVILLFVWLMGCRQLQKRFAEDNIINLFVRKRQKIAAAKSIMRAIQYSIQCDIVIQKYKPHRIATTSINGAYARAPISLAKKKGIPTYYIQHGLTYFESYEMRLLHDHAIVWGDYFKRRMISSGNYSPENIFVTGSTKFDEIDDQYKDRSNRESDQRTLKVTYFPSLGGGSTVSTSATDWMLGVVLNAVRKMPNTELTVKLKASDNHKAYDDYENEGLVKLNRSYDATQIILDSDIVIVSTSTVGLEACALARPLIVVALKGVHVSEVYQEYDAALIASSTEELIECLTKLREDEYIRQQIGTGQKRLAQDLFDGCVPGAAQRIAQFIVRPI